MESSSIASADDPRVQAADPQEALGCFWEYGRLIVLGRLLHGAETRRAVKILRPATGVGGCDDPDELLAALGRRRQAVAATLDALVAKQAHVEDQGVLRAAGRAVFRRAELLRRAELAWHEACPAVLGDAATGEAGTGGSKR
jgi:hypothetical protein